MSGAAVVLAAGRSRRMGRPKASLPFGTGTFLSTILDRLPRELLGWIGVVTTAPIGDCGAVRLVNPNPERGQLSSLLVGLEGGAAKFAWTLAVLVDQPAVSATTYRRLAEAAEAGAGHLWVPTCRGRRGHPVAFGRVCYPDLLQAPLEEGSRWVVARHRAYRVEVEVDDPEVLRDVDTPADYERLLEETREDPGA
ncbi:MAG: nucleotidyltransferase family protein [Candidatus Eremiobacterota bacterium]